MADQPGCVLSGSLILSPIGLVVMHRSIKDGKAKALGSCSPAAVTLLG